MRSYPFRVVIVPDNSREEFIHACEKIENSHPEFLKENLLIDVDGATIQEYTRGKEKIVIYDDYDVGVVRAMSDIDLTGVIEDYWSTHKRPNG